MTLYRDSATVFQTLCDVGVVPVIRCDETREALAAVGALREGGVPIAEITMTIPSALRVIETVLKTFGDTVTVGVGTVTDPATCAEAVRIGCHFVVTPVFNANIIAACRRAGVCMIGGALTPTEIYNTHQAGADAVKVFPASALGGNAYFRALKDPFPNIPLVPTGGVNLKTVVGFLEAGAVFVGAGTDLVSRKALANGDSQSITRRAEAYIEAIRRYRAAQEMAEEA